MVVRNPNLEIVFMFMKSIANDTQPEDLQICETQMSIMARKFIEVERLWMDTMVLISILGFVRTMINELPRTFNIPGKVVFEEYYLEAVDGLYSNSLTRLDIMVRKFENLAKDVASDEYLEQDSTIALLRPYFCPRNAEKIRNKYEVVKSIYTDNLIQRAADFAQACPGRIFFDSDTHYGLLNLEAIFNSTFIFPENPNLYEIPSLGYVY